MHRSIGVQPLWGLVLKEEENASKDLKSLGTHADIAKWGTVDKKSR